MQIPGPERILHTRTLSSYLGFISFTSGNMVATLCTTTGSQRGQCGAGGPFTNL